MAANGLMMLPNGWAIGFSKDVLIAALERGNRGDMAFNVTFADNAAEAAEMLRTDIFGLTDDWEGSEPDRDFVEAFAHKF